MDDLHIVSLYLKRDEQALKETDDKYRRLCFSIAKNILADTEDCRECVNDTYMAVWNSIPPNKPDNFKAYIAKTARNTALKRLEFNMADKRNPSMSVFLDEIGEIIADESVMADISAQELGQLINKFLKNEKADSRNVFILRYWYFHSISEISAKYNFSESKVKSMLFNSRKRLEKFLRQEGYL